MNEYTVSLSNAEKKALGVFVLDIQEWIDNVVHERCRVAIEEVFQTEVQRMLEDPSTTFIPADKELVVLNADLVPASEQENMR